MVLWPARILGLGGGVLERQGMQNFVVRSGRADLAVSMAGEGAALVFLHAGVADRRMWWGQLAAFADSHTVIAYDRRGFGETVCTPEGYRNVRDLDLVLEAVGMEHAVLIGCSQGGRIAVDYALSYPERVSGLVLVAPAISRAPEPETYPAKIQKLVDEIDKAERDGDIDWLNRLEAHAWLDGPGEKEGRVGGNVRKLFLDMNGVALRCGQVGNETGSINAYVRFGELKMPVEFVSGALDFLHINERSRRLSHVAPQARLTVMPGVAHLPSLEQPGRFNTLLRRLLKKLDQ